MGACTPLIVMNDRNTNSWHRVRDDTKSRHGQNTTNDNDRDMKDFFFYITEVGMEGVSQFSYSSKNSFLVEEKQSDSRYGA